MPQVGNFGVTVTNGVATGVADRAIGATPGSITDIIVYFDNAEVFLNGNSIFTGRLLLQMRNDLLNPLQASLLTRMLDPYQGYFKFLLGGTYTPNPNGTEAEILIDQIFSLGISQ